MALVPYDATVCACGYSFDADLAAITRTAEVIRAESEETLYETYLEARLQQALQNLKTLHEQCSPGKWSREHIERVQRALREAQAAKKDLLAQRLKTADARIAAAEAKIRKAQRNSPALRPAESEPRTDTAAEPLTPRQTFRAMQAGKAEKILPQRPAPAGPRECPHCGASAAAGVGRCGCGYEFSSENLLPSLVLPDDDRTDTTPS